jgi:hypothetical protein
MGKENFIIRGEDAAVTQPLGTLPGLSSRMDEQHVLLCPIRTFQARLTGPLRTRFG